MTENNPQRYSFLISIYLLISLLLFSVILLGWSYRSSINAVDKELSDAFYHRQMIAESIIENQLDYLELGLKNISDNRVFLEKVMRKDKKGAQNELFQILDSDETYNFDLIFISLDNAPVWTDASSSLFDIEQVLREISQKKFNLKSGMVHRFKNAKADITLMTEYVPLIHKLSGKVIGTLYGGVILNDNLTLIERIRSKTKARSVILFETGDFVGATDRQDAGVTRTLMKVRREVPPGTLFKGSDIIARYDRLSLFGKKTTLDLIMAVSSKPFLDIKRSFQLKTIILFILSIPFFLASVFLVNHFTYPSLKGLLNYSEEVSAGKTDVAYTPGRIIEFNKIGRSMVHMVKSLEKAHKNIQKEIAERKRTEDSLQTKDIHLKSLIRTIPELVWLKDQDGRYLFCNSRFERFFGAKEADIIGKTDYDFVDKKLADFFRENDLIAAKKGRPSINEEEVQYADDGHRELLETIKTPIYDTRGALIGILGVARDITEFKRNEKELRAQKEFTETALNSQQDTFFLFESATGKAIRWNRSFNIISGYSDDEISEMKVPDAFFDPESQNRITAFIRTVMESGIGTIELDLICRDGSRVPTEYSFATMKGDDKSSRYIVMIGRDLTERRHLEMRFQHLAENSTDWIWEFDEKNIFTYSSPGVENLLGYTPEEIVGKSAFDLIPSPEKERVRKAFAKSRDAHVPFTNLQNTNQHKDGHLVTIESSGSPIFNAKGQFKGYRGIDRDISDRKRMEDELRQVHKMESIGTLAGGIAHDFNNILGIIVGNTELALDDLTDWHPSQPHVKEIKSAALRAKDVVRQLLSFSRKTAQEQIPIDITDVVKESIKLIRASIPASIAIHSALSEKAATVLADATQIHQILINLCTNAAHAMADEGGLLEITLRPFILKQRTWPSFTDLAPGNYLELTVKDNGSGIEPEISDKIFDPYFTTKAVGEGTGMGLAVVHGIVKNHNGEIFVESKPGKGTTFTIILPTTQEHPAPKAAEPDQTDPPAGKEIILFVDDEEALVTVGKTILQHYGYRVEAFTSPTEALEAYQKDPGRFDLVITDMTMPDMSGVKLSEKIRVLRPDIPIIICTGHSSLIDEKKADKIGISAYAMKPVTMADMAQLIRDVLEKNQATALK